MSDAVTVGDTPDEEVNELVERELQEEEGGGQHQVGGW